MSIKHQVVRILLIAEVIVVIGFLLFGSQGFVVVRALKNELQKKKQEVSARELEIKELEVEKGAWEKDPFYVEKYAREKLSMARDGETIYVVK